MFGFSIVAIPLSYLAISAWFFHKSAEERLMKYFGRGLLFGVPCLLFYLILHGIFPEMQGRLLNLLRFWWARFLLPIGLAVGAYRLLHTFDETIHSKPSLRRFLSFFFGFQTLFCGAFTLQAYGFPTPFSVFFSPVLHLASIFAVLYFLERVVTETGIHAALWIALAVLSSLAFACVIYLFEARLEWLGAILAVAFLSASVYLERSILE